MTSGASPSHLSTTFRSTNVGLSFSAWPRMTNGLGLALGLDDRGVRLDLGALLEIL